MTSHGDLQLAGIYAIEPHLKYCAAEMIEPSAAMMSSLVIRAVKPLICADLRVQVKALRDNMSHNNGAVAMADAVLALIEGGQDD